MTRVLRHAPDGAFTEQHEEVPEGSFAERVRANLVSLRPGIEEECPEAIDLARDFHVLLHRGIVGRQEALRPGVSGSKFRRRVRSEDPFASPDITHLIFEAPTAIASPLYLLTRRVEHVGRPSAECPRRVGVELVKHAVMTMDKVVDFAADGVITAEERAEILVALAHVRKVCDDLEAAAR